MIIRKHNETDREAILALLKLNTPEYFSPNEEEDLIMYLDNFADNYFVVEVDGKLLGCGGFNLTDDRKTAKISWDIVHPQSQGMGVGSALTKHRIARIREIDGVEILLVRTSQLVYKFYEKFGMELREVVKDYWDKGFDLYRLDCDLDKAHD